MFCEGYAGLECGVSGEIYKSEVLRLFHKSPFYAHRTEPFVFCHIQEPNLNNSA